MNSFKMSCCAVIFVATGILALPVQAQDNQDKTAKPVQAQDSQDKTTKPVQAQDNQDSMASREAACDRYLKVVPLSKMFDDSYNEMAKNLPPEKRAEFITLMKEVTRLNNVEKITRASMIKTFTADELNALADFYGSQHGSSAMKKFGVYMAEVMPAVQGEMLRAIQEVNERKKKQ